MGLFNSKKQLPVSIYDRLLEASSTILSKLNDRNLIGEEDYDTSAWGEISEFILSELFHAHIIDSVDVLKFCRALSESIYRTGGFANMFNGFQFYKNQVNLILKGEHELPDVIVYNITHPSRNRKSFEEMPIFGIDIFKVIEVWAILGDVIGKYFFNKEEDITSLPLGIPKGI